MAGSKSPKGLYAARKLKRKRQKFRWSDLHYKRRALRLIEKYDLRGSFVCAYVGTIGLGSGLEVVIRAAKKLKDKGRTDIKFLLVGDGAIKDELQTQARDANLDNVVFTGRQDKALVPNYLSVADACLVHLKRCELFETVIPSKIFEAAAMAKPIILGVRGHAAELVNQAQAGVCIEPENEDELVEAVERFAADPEAAASLGRAGHDYVVRHFDREVLAQRYLDIVRRVAGKGAESVGACVK